MTPERIEDIAKAEQERSASEHDALMRKIRALKGWKKWLFILAFGNYPWIEEQVNP